MTPTDDSPADGDTSTRNSPRTDARRGDPPHSDIKVIRDFHGSTTPRVTFQIDVQIRVTETVGALLERALRLNDLDTAYLLVHDVGGLDREGTARGVVQAALGRPLGSRPPRSPTRGGDPPHSDELVIWDFHGTSTPQATFQVDVQIRISDAEGFAIEEALREDNLLRAYEILDKGGHLKEVGSATDVVEAALLNKTGDPEKANALRRAIRASSITRAHERSERKALSESPADEAAGCCRVTRPSGSVDTYPNVTREKCVELAGNDKFRFEEGQSCE